MVLSTRNECQQTRSGLKPKTAGVRFWAGGLGVSPNKRSERLAFYPACQSFALALRRMGGGAV